jgi:hypothetical protein
MVPAMSKRTLKLATAMAFLAFDSCFSFGQHVNPSPNNPRSQAEGTLTVTLSVMSSVGVVTGPDGRQRVVVANAAAASDNVSRVQYVPLNEVKPSGVVYQPGGNSMRKARRK